MTSPNPPTVRPAAVAGRFYPSDPAECRAQAQSFLEADEAAAGGPRWIGGIVPHAGWICSGAVAGQTIATIARHGPVDVVVVFGAVHTPINIDAAALDSHERWDVPGGQSRLPRPLERRLQERGNLFAMDDRMHMYEHAVEVNVPMIQLAFPAAAILPIEVPAIEVAELIGRKTAQTLAEAGASAVFLASSDLTHYGPNYRFTPAGVGLDALQWAKDNDRHLLSVVERLAASEVVPEVRGRGNACGAGAIAAMLAACKEMGAKTARLLTHTTSFETLGVGRASAADQRRGVRVGRGRITTADNPRRSDSVAASCCRRWSIERQECCRQTTSGIMRPEVCADSVVGFPRFQIAAHADCDSRPASAGAWERGLP